MKRVIYPALLLATTGMVLLAAGPEGFVGNWKSDPGTPTMTRDLALDGKVIVMTEHIPGRNGGPETIMIRKYPTDGSTVTMDKGFWAGATATGRMEGNVLTVDTTQANGTKWHDIWTLSEDGKHYTDEMSNTPAPGAAQGGREGRGGGGRGVNKFSYSRE
jgi:hypothetical protein